jgi:tetratricopeptide (TPR) repeat protein
MSQVAKLKKQAAEFEAKKQFEKAVAVYIKLLEEADSDADLDIGLFNRVGDLLIRQGNVADAVDYYERGIDKYSDTGFFNNAIALCNKVLRHSPGRASIYYKLGRISAKKGFTNEARTNFLEYADRMQKAGKVDEAFRALTEFADLCPDQDEIRLTLADQLVRAGRKAEAIEQLQTLHERLDGEGRTSEARGVVERMRALDPAVEPRKSQSRASNKSSELIFIDIDEPTLSPSTPNETPAVPPATPAASIETAPPPAAPPPPPPAIELAPLIELPAAETESIATPDEPLVLSSGTDTPIYTVDDAPIFIPPAMQVDEWSTEQESPAPAPPQPNDDETPEEVVGELEEFDVVEVVEEVEFVDDVEAFDEEPPPELLDEPMDELLAEVVRATSPSSAPAIPSPVHSPTLSISVEPPEVEALSLPAADMPVFGEALEDSEDIEQIEDIEEIEAAAEEIAEPEPVSASVEEIAEPEPVSASIDERIGASPVASVSPVASAPPVIDLADTALMSFAPEEPLVEEPAPDEPDAHSEPIPGILLADALEANARAEESFDAVPGILDDSLDEPIALPTPSQTRRSTAVAVRSVETLTAAVEGSPDDWVLHRDLGEAMLDAGDRAGGIRELEYAMAGSERDGKLDLASSIAEEVARLEPEVVKHQQKRVEYAFRTNDRSRLIEAYLGLANVLLRSEQAEKARSIYQRVLDLAPDEPRARLALSSITPVRPRIASNGFTPATPARALTPATPRASRPITAPAPRPSIGAPARVSAGTFINLGDMLRGDEIPRDTRMVVPEQEPTGDEEADFADMLRKFKAGIARNVAPEDHQSHYDLAIAYKEMGLIDEAIAEFQKALAGPTNRLPTYEALGQCFLEKSQYKLASSILSRALNENAGEDQLVGILYLLGRAAELQGKADEALAYYQRVFVVDIQFRDIVDRMSEVEQALR